MNINQLYTICENLGPASTFIVFNGKNAIFRCPYMCIPHPWDEKQIKGFKVVDDTNIEVYL